MAGGLLQVALYADPQTHSKTSEYSTGRQHEYFIEIQ